MPERRLGRAATLAVAGVVMVTAVMAGCAPEAKAPAGAAAGDGVRRVSAEAVHQEAVHRTVEISGTLEAEDEVTISAEAEGRVSRVLADLGDRVRAGQPLVELDREKGEYTLQQQRASMARALARYGAPDADHLPPIEQTPDVQKAQAELVQARQAHQRAEELFRRQLLPRQQLEEAETAHRARQAAYESALQNARNLRADIDGTGASARLADRQLRDSTIRAPFDGYVQKRLVSVGEFVKNQAPVMSVVRVDPLKATGEIPEKMAPWIRTGQPVSLRVDAFPGEALTGTVARISPGVNPATRAFPFEARVPNPSARLKPGTFARLHIESGKVEPVLTIPYVAVQYRYGTNRAFVVAGTRLVARELTLGDRLGDRVEILTGLTAGDVVATSDVERLADGMTVQVAPAAR